MSVMRWVSIGIAVACLAALSPEARPSGPARALATSTIPGTSVPVVHLGPAAQQPPVNPLTAPFDDGSLRKTEKITPILDKLYRVDQLSRATPAGAITAATTSALPADLAGMVAGKQLRIDAAGRVQIWADASSATSSAAADLAALGAGVQTTDDQHGIVQALVPISQLAAASALPSVKGVRLPSYGFAQTGAAESQGDAILNASTLRNTLTVSGKGVRVGVTSDGFEGLASSQATGDLPAVVDTSTCNVSPGATSPTASGAGAEGTAMAEIVHDLAPNAQIVAGYWGLNTTGTALDFNAAINCLAAHADVVVDDIGFFLLGPSDGTSVVSANTSAALNNVANPIRGYYTAVANQAMNHYHASWVDSAFHFPASTLGDWWELQRFQAGGGTTDAGFGVSCAAGVFCADAVTLGAGGTLTVFLQWNDTFGSATSDYDLLLFDSTGLGTISAASINRQGVGFPFPIEDFSITNTHGVTTGYGILIGKYKNLDVTTRSFDMYVLCTNCAQYPTGLPAPDNNAFHNFNTLAGSVPNQSDAGGGVVSVGAISAVGGICPGTAAPPPFVTIDCYSSRGPTVDARTKPDVTGIDCVAITGAAGFFNPFCGSSAAAPHVAGVAALELSCNPTLLAGSGHGTTAGNRTILHDGIVNSAVDLGPAGVDNTYGHGRVDTMLAAPGAGCVDTDGDGYPDGVETMMGKNPSSYCAAMRADVNGDGKVTLADLILVAQQYNQTVPPAPPRYEQNVPPNAKLTLSDLILMAQNYNVNVSTCP